MTRSSDDEDDATPPPVTRGKKKRKTHTPEEIASRASAMAVHAGRPKRVRVAPLALRVIPPALSAYLDGRGTEGPCGGFKRTRKWRVDNPKRGVIIQEVTRTFAVESYDAVTATWAAISGVALDGYVTVPGSSVEATGALYWELWTVGSDGRITNNEDSFALCSLIPNATTHADTTKGNFTIRGEAFFYPSEDATPASLGFTAGAVPAAGMLFSRDSDPAGALATANMVASGAAVVYSVTSTWDSTWAPQLVPTSPVPFTPDHALSRIT